MAMYLERNALVWGITGNLGGGKSLTAVYYMVNALRDGYYVISNITLDIPRLQRDIGPWVDALYMHISLDDDDIDPYKWPCGDPRGSGGRRRVVVVLDECAEWFDQYANSKSPKIQRLWSWLRHSSKRSQDVFLIVQRPDYMHKVLRILVARWLQVNDLGVWRVPLLRMRLPFCGGLCIFTPFDRTGQRVGSANFLRKSLWGRYYDTAECLNSTGAAYNAVYEDKRTPSVSLIPFFLWLFSLFVLFSSYFALTGAPARP